MLRRACFAIAFALLVTALAAPMLATASAQDDPEAGRPTAFVGSGEAYATQIFGNTEPSTFVSQILNARSPWVNTDFETGSTSTAISSLFDPGPAVTNGASLLCQFASQICVIPNFPPTYPLTARASNPLEIDATAQINGDTLSIGPVGVTGGDAHAHAGRDLVSADATVQGNSLGSGGAVLMHVGNSSASNTVSFAGDGSLVSASVSAVSDVTILGIIHIDSIEARATSTAHLDGTVENDVHLDIAGASLAGVPITIGDEGINLGGAPSGGGLLGTIGQALSPLLSSLRGSIHTVGTTDTKDSTGASGTATGLLIDLFPNTDASAGTSVRLDVLLAFAGSHAYVYTAPPSNGSSGGTSTGGGSTGSGSTGSGSTGRPGSPSVVIPGTPGTTATGAGGSTVEEIISSLLGGSAAYRMKFFYLAWTLSMIGCALGSRFRPARLNALRTTGGNDVQSP